MKKSLVTLTLAGLLWGLTVPLSKLALEWLDGGWLTVVRFGLAAPILALLARKDLPAGVTPASPPARAARLVHARDPARRRGRLRRRDRAPERRDRPHQRQPRGADRRRRAGARRADRHEHRPGQHRAGRVARVRPRARRRRAGRRRRRGR